MINAIMLAKAAVKSKMPIIPVNFFSSFLGILSLLILGRGKLLLKFLYAIKIAPY